ncbi:MAG: hypothetical protein N3A54_03915 [Patescibacteria group bacterium]|nr:hypothetical protein [Patescibacteria group bacterium]
MKKYYSKQITKKTKFGEQTFYSLPYFPSFEELYDSTDFHIYNWKSGDRYIDISQKFYGTPEFWWVIAFINKTPLESSISPGENIYVPMDIFTVVNSLRKYKNV